MAKGSIQWHDELRAKIFSDPEAKAIYEAFALQLDLAIKMKKAREKAHLSQGEVASKMGTQAPAISRLESAASNKKSPFPSIFTLMKYASAIGKKLKID